MRESVERGRKRERKRAREREREREKERSKELNKEINAEGGREIAIYIPPSLPPAPNEHVSNVFGRPIIYSFQRGGINNLMRSAQITHKRTSACKHLTSPSGDAPYPLC